MKKSATEVMQELLSAAAVDAVQALKSASQGMPNSLLRELNAIHANTAFTDLPAEVRAAIQSSVRSAFARLMKEGYTIAPVGTAPPPPRHSPPYGERRPERRPGDRPRGPVGERRGDRPRGPRGPGGGKPGGRPGGKPRG